MAENSSPASGLYVGDIERQNVPTSDNVDQDTYSETSIGTVTAGGSITTPQSITFENDERPIIGKFKAMFDKDVVVPFEAWLVFPDGTEQQVDQYYVQQGWIETTPLAELMLPPGTNIEIRKLQNPLSSESLDYNIVTVGLIDKV